MRLEQCLASRRQSCICISRLNHNNSRDREPEGSWLCCRWPPDSVDLVALFHTKRRRRCGDAVHGGAAVVDGRKPRLHVLRETKLRLRQRVEPAKLIYRESDLE